MTRAHSGIVSWQSDRSEIEFIVQQEDQLIPIEVKSGWITRAKNLEQVVSKYHPPYAVIMTRHELKIDLLNKYHYYPLYLASRKISAAKFENVNSSIETFIVTLVSL